MRRASFRAGRATPRPRAEACAPESVAVLRAGAGRCARPLSARSAAGRDRGSASRAQARAADCGSRGTTGTIPAGWRRCRRWMPRCDPARTPARLWVAASRRARSAPCRRGRLAGTTRRAPADAAHRSAPAVSAALPRRAGSARRRASGRAPRSVGAGWPSVECPARSCSRGRFAMAHPRDRPDARRPSRRGSRRRGSPWRARDRNRSDEPSSPSAATCISERGRPVINQK